MSPSGRASLAPSNVEQQQPTNEYSKHNERIYPQPSGHPPPAFTDRGVIVDFIELVRSVQQQRQQQQQDNAHVHGAETDNASTVAPGDMDAVAGGAE